jgi:hypothetical protein
MVTVVPLLTQDFLHCRNILLPNVNEVLLNYQVEPTNPIVWLKEVSFCPLRTYILLICPYLVVYPSCICWMVYIYCITIPANPICYCNISTTCITYTCTCRICNICPSMKTTCASYRMYPILKKWYVPDGCHIHPYTCPTVSRHTTAIITFLFYALPPFHIRGQQFFCQIKKQKMSF